MTRNFIVKTIFTVLPAALILSISCISIQIPTSSPTPVADNQFSIESPGNNDRFLTGESILFKVRGNSRQIPDINKLTWISSISGNLGSGSQIESASLPAGDHQITLTDGVSSSIITIRIFNDLWQLYQSSPSQNEISRIMSDFTIKLIDGNGSDEKWAKYNDGAFNQKWPDPSSIVSISRLDILRRQLMSQPFPFGNGKSGYEILKNSVRVVNLNLGCEVNIAGGRAVNLNRSFSVWDGRQSGSAGKPDACKVPIHSPPLLNEYTSALYLLMHEARHCEQDDPGHVACKGFDNMDQSLENGSGHARAALYLIWIYKYGIYDPPSIKEKAKTTALSILNERFCTPVKHNNPLVQTALKEMGLNQ
jgi:hypothetical protein